MHILFRGKFTPRNILVSLDESQESVSPPIPQCEVNGGQPSSKVTVVESSEEFVEQEEENRDWGLETSRNENKLYRPHRDVKSEVIEKVLDDDIGSQSGSTKPTPIDSREIRTRVKKSLDRKQRDMRRRKRGETSAVTRSRRENRESVKHGAQAWKDGW